MKTKQDARPQSDEIDLDKILRPEPKEYRVIWVREIE